MRKLLLLSVLSVMLFPFSAFADSAKGTITKVDPTASIMQLTDGNDYTLPGEFDFSVIREGMKVTVFYDKDGTNRYVTDIEPEGGYAASPEGVIQ